MLYVANCRMYINIYGPGITVLTYVHVEPQMADLQKIVIPKIMTNWEQLAEALRYDDAIIDSIKHAQRDNPKECCRALFKDWLQTNNGAEVGRKVWSTLFATIKEHDLVGDDIREEMIAKVKQLKQ